MQTHIMTKCVHCNEPTEAQQGDARICHRCNRPYRVTEKELLAVYEETIRRKQESVDSLVKLARTFVSCVNMPGVPSATLGKMREALKGQNDTYNKVFKKQWDVEE